MRNDALVEYRETASTMRRSRGVRNLETNVMSFVPLRHASAAALSALSILGAPPFARAEIKDYEFQLATGAIKTGDAIVAVRLIHKPDGKAVSDAVIFAKRLDMAPEGMESMTTTIEPAPSVEPGVYR